MLGRVKRAGSGSLFRLSKLTMAGVPVLFLAVIAAAVLVGEVVARFYSEPMNRRLRGRWGDGAQSLGSVVETTPQKEAILP